MRIRLLLFCLLACCFTAMAQKKSKEKKVSKKPLRTEYINAGDETPVADTAHRFTGIIKYKMTTDDPADRDSMFIIFGENKIRITMFTPGYKEGQIFEANYIANFLDSGLYIIDSRAKTYKMERLGDRNSGVEISLYNNKKTATIARFLCNEYNGEMVIKEDVFEAAALLSKDHSYLYAMDYNFLNIQPVVVDYRIVLGWRTKTADNENTYIVAYQVTPGDVSSYFDLSGYKQQ